MTVSASGEPVGSRAGGANVPWEQRDTAISSGFDPHSVTERSARRRTGEAGLGRPVTVPVYVRPHGPGGTMLSPKGLLVRLHAGGRIVPDRDHFLADLGDPSGFWLAVGRAVADPGAQAARDGWVRLTVGAGAEPRHLTGYVILRATDLDLLAAALVLRRGGTAQPQDAPVERVTTRFLGRLDGLDGTPSAGLWGRLALEVVRVRHPDRLADTTGLRWHASWGAGGFPAGSGGRAHGYGGHEMLLDLAEQQVRVAGRRFRVRLLPDWEREQAAADLGLPARRLVAWPVVPLEVILGCFRDIPPAFLDADPQHGAQPGGPQDERRPGPQDAR